MFLLTDLTDLILTVFAVFVLLSQVRVTYLLQCSWEMYNGRKRFFFHALSILCGLFFLWLWQNNLESENGHRTCYMGLDLQPLLKQSFFGTRAWDTGQVLSAATSGQFLWIFLKEAKKDMWTGHLLLEITLTGTIISKDSSSAGSLW